MISLCREHIICTVTLKKKRVEVKTDCHLLLDILFQVLCIILSLLFSNTYTTDI